MNPKLKEFFDRAINKNSMTPDLAHITRHYEALPVFVYGTQQRNFSENYQMRNAVKIGTARTARNTHMMYHYKSGEWVEPIVFHMPTAQHTGCIIGELYVVPVKEFPNLDNLMSNTLWVRRAQEHVKFKEYSKDGGIKICLTEAFIYLGNDNFWKQQSMSDKLKRAVRFNSEEVGPYYTYMYTDDKPNRDLQKAAIAATKAQMAGANTTERVLM